MFKVAIRNLSLIKIGQPSTLHFSTQNIQNGVILRQLVDKVSSTYTFIMADARSRDAVIIDPVFEQAERDLTLIKEMGLNLKFARKIKKQLTHVKSVLSFVSKGQADVHLKEGDEVKFGSLSLLALSTPGHTDGCMSFVSHANRCVFTGDALLIRGCGRTDFQQGNASTLYRSVTQKIFVLPEDYTVYPAHDYNGQLCSTVGEEKRFNPRLSKSEAEFIKIMSELKLANPTQIEVAVPNNMTCGLHYVKE